MGAGALFVGYGLAIRSTLNDVTVPVVTGICLFSLGLFALRLNVVEDHDKDDEPIEDNNPPREYMPKRTWSETQNHF